jgi:hypothetical protein
VVKARDVMHLDGDFSQDFPTPERFTIKQGDQWTLVERGPRYVNSYEVTAFDETGRAWLERLQRTE